MLTRLSPLTFSFFQLIHSTGCVLWKRVQRPLSRVDWCILLCVFFKDFFFWMQIFFKAFVEFVTTQLLFYVLVFWLRGTCGILALQPGIRLSPPLRIGR